MHFTHYDFNMAQERYMLGWGELFGQGKEG